MTTVKAAGIGGTGIIFVNGDFNVDVNNTVTVGNSLFIVAKGKINFSENITSAAGIFVADGGMTADGVAASRLTVNGSLYSASSGGDVIFTRDFTDPTSNNTLPAVTVSYRPDLMFSLPGSFLKVLSGWKQN